MNAFAVVILVALDGWIGSGVPKQIERFGGGPATVQAAFLKFPDQNVTVEASLYLDGDKLLAPLGEPVPLTVQPGDDPRVLAGTFEIPLPEVKKPVVFRVILSAKVKDQAGLPCGDFRIIAFPRNTFSESLADPEALPEIAIAGKLPGLRELLEKNHLRHRDINLKTPDALPPGSIVIAEMPADTDAAGYFPDTKKLIFTSGSPASIPWILEAKEHSFLVKAPPPQDFRESPSAQRMLLELLR